MTENISSTTNGFKKTVVTTKAINLLPESYYSSTTMYSEPSIIGAEYSNNVGAYSNLMDDYLVKMSKMLGETTTTTTTYENANGATDGSCFDKTYQTKPDCGCKVEKENADSEKSVEAQLAEVNAKIKELEAQKATTDGTGTGATDSQAPAKDTKAKETKTETSDNEVKTTTDGTSTKKTDGDANKGLTERVSGSGIYASDASTDITVDVKKDQWISKVTQALYGAGGKEDSALYEAIAKMNEQKDESGNIIYTGSKLNFPREIKVGDKEYKVPEGMTNEELQKKIEENRVNIKAPVHKSVLDVKKADAASTEAAKKSEADAKKNADAAVEAKKKAEAEKAQKAKKAAGVKKVSAKKDDSFSQKLWKFTPMYALEVVINKAKDLNALLKVGHSIRTAGGDDAYVAQKAEKVAGNKQVVATGVNTATQVVANHPENLQPALDALTPKLIEQMDKNVESLRPLAGKLAGMTLEEMQKPENKEKINKLVYGMAQDDKLIAVVMAKALKQVKGSAEIKSLTTDTMNDMLQGANRQLLTQAFGQVAGDILKTENNRVIDNIVKLVLDKVAYKALNEPQYVAALSVAYDEVMERQNGLIRAVAERSDDKHAEDIKTAKKAGLLK